MKVTKHISRSAAHYGRLPAMELVLSSAKELGKEISDEDLCEALYLMCCG